MAQTVRRAIEGRYPSCYVSSRIEERRAKARALRAEQQRKLEKPEDFVCYSDSDSEEETPTQQHKILSTSYNFILDMCWLDDEFLVTGSRDSKLALWRAPQVATTPDYYIAPQAVKDCRSGIKVRALTFNAKWREIAALTLNGYIHVFNAETFRQTLSRKLPSCQDLVCLATQVNTLLQYTITDEHHEVSGQVSEP
ncbi:putative ddb1-and cul4-associated factor 12 [Operophtera brumata]|uniref:Putative ddb1-and cul4-associated factor 12 n=1 Tax=Operophtera brumata TaxID=104452 RepID=A0A0L7L0K8_OPEBR|nr:putative ddb1-and cul4-associated factor 12 [Operophtera brumata]